MVVHCSESVCWMIFAYYLDDFVLIKIILWTILLLKWTIEL
jgi:hypothetical protein